MLGVPEAGSGKGELGVDRIKTHCLLELAYQRINIDYSIQRERGTGIKVCDVLAGPQSQSQIRSTRYLTCQPWVSYTPG